MKTLLLLCLLALLALLLTSCVSDRPIKIISTGERGYVTDWDGLYKTGDTIIIYQTFNSSPTWNIDNNWSTKKDISISSTTFRVAVITK